MPSSSAIADGFDGSVVHLANHDVSFYAMSRAPLAKLRAYKLWIVVLSERKRGIADRSLFFVWCLGTIAAGIIVPTPRRTASDEARD